MPMEMTDTGAKNLQLYLEYHTDELPLLTDDIDPHSSCNRWIELYSSLNDPHEDSENLPLIMLLIHPEVYFNRDGIKQRGHIGHKKKKLKKKSTICELSFLITNVPCGSEARSEGDHHWPFSLGGSNDPGNTISLCVWCNRWKSNNPWMYKWDAEKVPGWAIVRLKKIFNIKA